MKVFIDANVVLDLLLQRHSFYLNAEKIFSLSDSREGLLFEGVSRIALESGGVYSYGG